MPLNMFHGVTFSSIAIDSRVLDVGRHSDNQDFWGKRVHARSLRHSMTLHFCFLMVLATNSSIFSNS